MMRFSDELLKRCRKVVDVVERDLAKMEQVKKAVLDLVVIGDLLKRCRKVVDVVEGDPGKMEQVKNAVLSCCDW